MSKKTNILMHKIVVVGGNPLKGTVRISGAKNAVLPVMASTLLAGGKYEFSNVPGLRDVRTMSEMLECLGAVIERNGDILRIDSSDSGAHEAPYDLVKTMRASIYVLGPLVSRIGIAKVSLPGGCAWGPRPVNMHLEGLRKLGAQIEINEGYILAKADRLQGSIVAFEKPSVGATGNILMAATLARGTTVIENAAMEPEIVFLAHFLQKMGARIEGIGTSRIEVEGVDSLHTASDRIIADRIESGTFMAATHIVGGDVLLEGTPASVSTVVIDRLRESGAQISESKQGIHIVSDGNVRPVNVTTAVYPGFPTDMQAQWMALMSIADGSSVITETIFKDRFTHVAELQRLGAEIVIEDSTAFIRGSDHLSGAHVMSTDLRASASLIMAGLVAKGRTDISRVYHIDRGYEKIEKKLKRLGAKIWRDQEELVI